MRPKPATQDPPTWMTVAEAAAHARVSRATIHQGVRDGDLLAYTIGKGNLKYRLKLSDVDAWMESRPHEPAGSASAVHHPRVSG